MIDGHGDDIYRYGDIIKYNFSSNIFQGVDHTSLKEYLKDSLDVISNYPEPAPYTIEALLAQKHGLPAECVMVTNGAADAIHLIARTYQGKSSVVLHPTFAEYDDACRISGHKLKQIYDINIPTDDADIVWICNPNNPTGKVHDPELLRKLLRDNPQTLFVIDQAYHLYTDKRVLPATEVLYNDNLILLYSMTKDYAIPGLRIGYIVSNAHLMSTLKEQRVPWSVNAIAIEAAKYLLSNNTHNVNIQELHYEVKRVSGALQDLGISVTPTETNFMLCKLPNAKASDLKEFLIHNYGILIRDASNFEGLTLHHFRIAVQTAYQNDILIKALRVHPTKNVKREVVDF